MGKEKRELQNNYICAKCRSRQANVREIVIPKSGLLDLLPSKDNRYIEVTCILCGYTEFYNRSIYCRSLEEEPVKGKKLPIPEKGE